LKVLICKSQGGLSTGYKNFIAENDIADETYNEDGTALFRIQGSGPDNMQAIQVETVDVPTTQLFISLDLNLSSSSYWFDAYKLLVSYELFCLVPVSFLCLLSFLQIGVEGSLDRVVFFPFSF